MSVPSIHEVTQLLKAWTAGDHQALEKLTPLVYRQLHQVAQRCMAGERSDHTLQTTRWSTKHIFGWWTAEK